MDASNFAHTSNLFKNLNVLNTPDKIIRENFIIICKNLNGSLPKTFKNLSSFKMFSLKSISLNYAWIDNFFIIRIQSFIMIIPKSCYFLLVNFYNLVLLLGRSE